MALSPELNDLIEQEAAGLDKKGFLQTHMTYDDFTKGYSRLLGQAKTDLPLLCAAGFDASLIPKYDGYLEKLSLDQGDKTNVQFDKQPIQKEFMAAMPAANAHKKRLMAAARFVVRRTGNPEDKKVYAEIRQGRGDVDTLNDNIALVRFARNHRSVIAQVRPGGRVIDDAYLNEVEQGALGLLQLCGMAQAGADRGRDQRDRQHRLLTLCVLAKRELKLFAEMAFFDDMEHYNRFYADDK